MTTKQIEQIFVDIIKTCMSLPDNYGTTSTGDVIPSVIIYAQNIKLFNTNKLQITVRTARMHVYSSRSEVKELEDEKGDTYFVEIQDLNVQRMMQIDCYSRNVEARNRFWEVAAALKSDYANQQMDLYNFKIGNITDSYNTSGLDGGSDINRFTTTFNVLSHEQKITPINYYDQFGVTAETESGEFANINNYND